MTRQSLWKPLVILLVVATTATAFYAVRRHVGGAPHRRAAGGSPAPEASRSQTVPVVALRQSFEADPPFGSGFLTHGTYLQVSGVDHLDAVNAALRQLIVDDQTQDRARFAELTPGATTPPGEYGSGPGKPPAISASSVIVSALLATEAVPPDGEWHDSWVSATLLVPSAHPVQLASMFTDPAQGLAAVAAATKDYLLANVPCVAVPLNDPTDGLDPTNPANYQHFALTPAGLVIGLEQQQVGSQSCGSLTATVIWPTIKPLMSPVGVWLVAQLR